MLPGRAVVLAQARFPRGRITGAQWTDAQTAAVLAPLRPPRPLALPAAVFPSH